MIRECENEKCTNQFNTKSKQHNARFCSNQCRAEHHNRIKRNKRIAQNLCTQCGKKEREKDLSYCEDCRDYFKNYYKNTKECRNVVKR